MPCSRRSRSCSAATPPSSRSSPDHRSAPPRVTGIAVGTRRRGRDHADPAGRRRPRTPSLPVDTLRLPLLENGYRTAAISDTYVATMRVAVCERFGRPIVRGSRRTFRRRCERQPDRIDAGGTRRCRSFVFPVVASRIPITASCATRSSTRHCRMVHAVRSCTRSCPTAGRSWRSLRRALGGSTRMLGVALRRRHRS